LKNFIVVLLAVVFCAVNSVSFAELGKPSSVAITKAEAKVKHDQKQTKKDTAKLKHDTKKGNTVTIAKDQKKVAKDQNKNMKDDAKLQKAENKLNGPNGLVKQKP